MGQWISTVDIYRGRCDMGEVHSVDCTTLYSLHSMLLEQTRP